MNRPGTGTFGVACLSVVLASQAASGAEWPQFRGPGGLAAAPDESVPDSFGPDENVLWKVAVPAGHSSPIVWGNRVVLTATKGTTLSILALDRRTGSLLWERDFEAQGEELLQHRDTSPAAPSPCTDGERIHAYFGAYGVITLDMEGKTLWERRFPVEKNSFGTGTSPVLHDGTLFLVRDVAGQSTIHALDAATGDERWGAARPDGANYSSPFVWEREDRTEVVVAGTTELRSYAASTGETLWRVGNQTILACPSPTAVGDTLYYGGWSTGNAPHGEKLEEAFDDPGDITQEIFDDADRLVAHLDANGDGGLQRDELPAGRGRDAFDYLDFDGSGSWDLDEMRSYKSRKVPGSNVMVAIRGGGRGDVTQTHVIWERRKALPYVASPLAYAGRLYYVKRGGFVTAVDLETGEPFYEGARLGEGGEYYASPLGVGDRVLIGSIRGSVFVLGTGDELEIVARNRMGEGIVATPAVVDDTLYLRTEGHLWAITELSD